MARVLVVGATGYLGSHMVAELKAAGHWVRALSRREEAFDGAAQAPDEVFVGQATRRETLDGLCDGLCDGIDYVFSALGQTRQKDKQSFWDVDYEANKAVLHLAVAAGVKQFLFISVIRPELSADLDIVAAREALVLDMVAAPIPHTTTACGRRASIVSSARSHSPLACSLHSAR
jgi:nucleoside-diphosphate-sugar epimerase